MRTAKVLATALLLAPMLFAIPAQAKRGYPEPPVHREYYDCSTIYYDRTCWRNVFVFGKTQVPYWIDSEAQWHATAQWTFDDCDQIFDKCGQKVQLQFRRNCNLYLVLYYQTQRKYWRLQETLWKSREHRVNHGCKLQFTDRNRMEITHKGNIMWEAPMFDTGPRPMRFNLRLDDNGPRITLSYAAEEPYEHWAIKWCRGVCH
jgi:hypothetical protein